MEEERRKGGENGSNQTVMVVFSIYIRVVLTGCKTSIFIFTNSYGWITVYFTLFCIL